MVESMIKLSIIVPVYNAAQNLRQCLDSLRSQTLTELEVILVDDHGQDNSMVIIQDFITSNHLEASWHIVATARNGGPGLARNEGLKHAKGEYIVFADADDWLEPQMMEYLYRNAQQFDADISSCDAILDYEDGLHSYMRNPKVPAGELSKSHRRYILRNYVSNFTTMLLRREWLLQNGISFPNSRSGEDSSFVGQCYLSCRKIVQNDRLDYHYRIHSDSLSHRKHVYRGHEKKIAFQALIDYARAKGLLPAYRWTLYWIYFKKAIVTSVSDYIVSITAR